MLIRYSVTITIVQMSFSSLYQKFKHFYSSCDKPTFWFCLIELNQIVGFTPGVPSPVLYVTLCGYALYQLVRNARRINTGLMCFLAYVPIGLLVESPDSVFRSWERFVLFAVLLACVSPLFTSRKAITNRRMMFQMLLVICTIIGVGSFLARFLGINCMQTYRSDVFFQVGSFGGLTTHSMLLGPVAGISAMYMAYLGYMYRKKMYWLLFAASACSVMFSASRSALAACVAGLTVMLFKLSGTVSRFAVAAVVFVTLGVASFPLWGSAMYAVIEKNERNIEAGSMIDSRESLWESRYEEFKSSPVFGVGFAAIDRKLSGQAGLDERTGMVESGSSWLIVLSMTGLLGACLIFPVLTKAYIEAYRDTDKYAALVCGTLTMFFVHMIAEGYIFYGGSQLAFMLWLTVGVAMDCKYLIEE